MLAPFGNPIMLFRLTRRGLHKINYLLDGSLKEKGAPRAGKPEWLRLQPDSSAAASNQINRVASLLETACTSAMFACPTCFMPRSCAAFTPTRASAASMSKKLLVSDGVVGVWTGREIKDRISPFPESFEIHPARWLEGRETRAAGSAAERLWHKEKFTMSASPWRSS